MTENKTSLLYSFDNLSEERPRQPGGGEGIASPKPLESVIEREAGGLSSTFADCSPDDRHYLAICAVMLRGIDEFYDEVAKNLAERESNGAAPARQASIVRLTYLRAESDGCAALFEDLAGIGEGRSNPIREGDGTPEAPELRRARMFALIKSASHLLSKVLSTCSFLLSEEAAIDPVLVNHALIFFAKLSSLFGAAGNPVRSTEEIAGFLGLRGAAI